MIASIHTRSTVIVAVREIKIPSWKFQLPPEPPKRQHRSMEKKEVYICAIFILSPINKNVDLNSLEFTTSFISSFFSVLFLSFPRSFTHPAELSKCVRMEKRREWDKGRQAQQQQRSRQTNGIEEKMLKNCGREDTAHTQKSEKSPQKGGEQTNETRPNYINFFSVLQSSRSLFQLSTEKKRKRKLFIFHSLSRLGIKVFFYFSTINYKLPQLSQFLSCSSFPQRFNSSTNSDEMRCFRFGGSGEW